MCVNAELVFSAQELNGVGRGRKVFDVQLGSDCIPSPEELEKEPLPSQ